MALRLIFMGTPDFSVPMLHALHAAGHDIVCVYSQPPRPAGRRGLELTPSPVQKAAEALNIPVRTPVSLKSVEEQQAFAELDADVAVVVAYGLLLPKAILEGTKFGCYNGHASLLPRWRGAAPIHRAIMAGDAKTGMMVMKMEEGLDTGPVALTHEIAIDTDMTTGSLHDRLSAAGAALMVEAMAKLEAGDLPLVPQPDEGVTYARKIDKAEARIDFSLSAPIVDAMIRGLSPFPGAWCECEGPKGKERLKVLQSRIADGASQGPVVQCADGAVELVQVQRAGSKPVSGEDFLRGFGPNHKLDIA